MSTDTYAWLLTLTAMIGGFAAPWLAGPVSSLAVGVGLSAVFGAIPMTVEDRLDSIDDGRASLFCFAIYGVCFLIGNALKEAHDRQT